MKYEASDPYAWPDLHNPTEGKHRAEAELSALRTRLRDLIDNDGKRDGRVSCRLLTQALEGR